MAIIRLPTLKCQRCHHKWIPRQSVVRICPNCKSAAWDTRRTSRQGERTDLKKRRK